jgi:hypothetical protein
MTAVPPTRYQLVPPSVISPYYCTVCGHWSRRCRSEWRNGTGHHGPAEKDE